MIWLAKDTHVGRCLELYGEYSQQEVEVLRQLLPESAVMVEVGANIGAITVPLAKAVGERGAVIAFEPQRVVFQVLCANLVLNSLTNVQAVNAACGEKSEWIACPVFDIDKDNNFGGVELRRPAVARKESVQVFALDQFSLERLDLLKIDVEGMEAEVLHGAQKTIERHRPVLYIEHNEQFDDSAMIREIRGCGYNPYWHLPPLFEPGNFRGSSKDVFPNIVSFNMLFMPKERTTLVEGFKPIVSGDWKLDHGLELDA